VSVDISANAKNIKRDKKMKQGQRKSHLDKFAEEYIKRGGYEGYKIHKEESAGSIRQFRKKTLIIEDNKDVLVFSRDTSSFDPCILVTFYKNKMLFREDGYSNEVYILRQNNRIYQGSHGFMNLGFRGAISEKNVEALENEGSVVILEKEEVGKWGYIVRILKSDCISERLVYKESKDKEYKDRLRATSYCMGEYIKGIY